MPTVGALAKRIRVAPTLDRRSVTLVPVKLQSEPLGFAFHSVSLHALDLFAPLILIESQAVHVGGLGVGVGSSSPPPSICLQ